MAAPPSVPRQRPASARGRLIKEQNSVFLSSNEPAPESRGVHSGPGQYRQFNANSRHELRDPLRHGQENSRELPFYSMGKSTSGSASRETSAPMRTLDFAKLNKDRHQWQRIDTFQTTFGNGQASMEDSRQRTRTGSRSRERTSHEKAVGLLGLELEDLRLELRSAVVEIKEDLAMAVNQTIAEIRQDVRAETASLRQNLGSSEGGSAAAQRVEPAMLEELAREVDRSREELLQGQQLLAEEIRSCQRTPPEFSTILAQLREVGARVDRSHAELQQKVNPTPILAALVDSKSELKSAIQSCTSSATEAVTKNLTENLNKVQKELDLRCLLEPLMKGFVMNPADGSVKANVDFSSLLEELKKGFAKFDTCRDLRECLAETGLVESMAHLRTGLQQLDIRADLARMQQWQQQFDLSPVVSAVQSAVGQASVDLSPVIEQLHENRADLTKAIRRSHGDVSPLLPLVEQVEHMRTTISAAVKAFDASQENSISKNDVAALLQAVNGVKHLDIAGSLNQLVTAMAKADVSSLQGELQRVLEELRDVRSGEVTKILRLLQQQQEVDLSPVLRALQERKRAEEESAEKLTDELHKLRKDCDMSEVLATVQQIDAGKLLKAIRDSKVSQEDLDPIAEEVRRVSEELRQTRFSTRDLSQLLDEVTNVKLEIQRQARHELDVPQILTAIKENRVEIDFSQVLAEFQFLKEVLANMRREEQRSQFMASDVQQRHMHDTDSKVIAKALDDMARVTAQLDLGPVLNEIENVKVKIDLGSALKRQTQSEHMTKSDFAAALEELRGHFSLVLSSMREAVSGNTAAAEFAVNTRLHQLLETQRETGSNTAEDLDYLRRKVTDARSVIGQVQTQVGSRQQEVMQQANKPSEALSHSATTTSFAAASSFGR